MARPSAVSMLCALALVRPAAAQAPPPDSYLVLPFENAAGARALDWMISALATTLAGKLEAHPKLLPAYGAAPLAGLPAQLEPAAVAAWARAAGARWVFGGSFSRRHGKIAVRVRLFRVVAQAPGLAPVAESGAAGERYELLALLDRALLAVLDAAGLRPSGEALAALERLPTGDLYALTLYGRAQNWYHGLGRPADLARAEEVLARAIYIDPQLADAHHLMALVQLARGQRGKAAAEYTRALDLRPGYFEALVGLAQLYRERKRLRPAVELLERALGARPSDLQLRFLLAELERESGELDRARANLLRVVAAAPQHLGAHRALAQVYGARGEVAELAAELERVAELAPRDANVWMDLAAARARLGDTRLALAAYQEVLALQPGNVQALKFVGDLHRRIGERAAAIAAWSKMRVLAPTDPRPYFLLARAQFDAGEVRQAERLLLEAAARFPRFFSEAQADLGVLALSRGDLASGRRYLELALAGSSSLSPAHFDLALLFERSAQYERALAEARTAAELDPDDADASYLAGLIALHLGRVDEARRAFSDALDRVPSRHDARQALELLDASVPEPAVRSDDSGAAAATGSGARSSSRREDSSGG